MISPICGSFGVLNDYMKAPASALFFCLRVRPAVPSHFFDWDDNQGGNQERKGAEHEGRKIIPADIIDKSSHRGAGRCPKCPATRYDSHDGAKAARPENITNICSDYGSATPPQETEGDAEQK